MRFLRGQLPSGPWSVLICHPPAGHAKSSVPLGGREIKSAPFERASQEVCLAIPPREIQSAPFERASEAFFVFLRT